MPHYHDEYMSDSCPQCLRDQVGQLEERIATLEAELADEAADNNSLRRMYLDQCAATNALRDALERTGCYCHKYGDDKGEGDGSWYTSDFTCARCSALASTPAADLAAHDAEVLERAARAFDSYAPDAADAIRHALAAQAQEVTK